MAAVMSTDFDEGYQWAMQRLRSAAYTPAEMAHLAHGRGSQAERARGIEKAIKDFENEQRWKARRAQ
jgi:hypothetical protein